MSNAKQKVDQETIDLLNKVTKQINEQNEKLINNGINFISNTGYNNPMNTVQTTTFTLNNPTIGYNNPNVGYNQIINPPIQPLPNVDIITSSPYIYMEKDIYKNEFEESGIVEIGDPNHTDHARIIEGVYYPPSSQWAAIGLIDGVSEDENELYAKLPDGEIVPFNGHIEKFSIEMNTWNYFHRSDLIDSEIKKAATCYIMLNDKLARIIEGTDIQDLLMKADRAIDEIKVMPFSIARDGFSLIGRKIYYNNQPAVISNIDELNNLLYISPDNLDSSPFAPPVEYIENDNVDEWNANFADGLYAHDYSERIYWYRDSTDVKNDAGFQDLIAQPIPAPQPGIQQYPSIPQPGIQPYPNVIYPTVTPYTIRTGGSTSPYKSGFTTGGDTITITLDAMTPANYNTQSIDKGQAVHDIINSKTKSKRQATVKKASAHKVVDNNDWAKEEDQWV